MLLSDYARFTKHIYKHYSNNFVAKHVVQLGNYAFRDESLFKKDFEDSYIFVYDFTHNVTKKKKKGITFKTDDYIIFNNEKRAKTQEKDFTRAYYILNASLFAKFSESLDEATKWLKDPEFENLFTTNQDGKISGISTNKIFSVIRNGRTWLMLQPAIITDEVGITYQGIQIRSENGVLGNLSGDEFINFKYMIKSVMENFYMAGLQLFTASVLALQLNEEVPKQDNGDAFNF